MGDEVLAEEILDFVARDAVHGQILSILIAQFFAGHPLGETILEGMRDNLLRQLRFQMTAGPGTDPATAQDVQTRSIAYAEKFFAKTMQWRNSISATSEA